MKKIILIFLTFISLNVLAQSTPFEIVEEISWFEKKSNTIIENEKKTNIT